MSTVCAESSSASSASSGLDYEETELKLALPGVIRTSAGRGGPESERKRWFEEEDVGLTLGGDSRSDLPEKSAEIQSSDAGKAPAAKAQVIGWPPVRNFRKNVLIKGCTYVKVAADGAPYLRKVDIEAYRGYQELLAALQDLFSFFTIRTHADESRFVDPVNGTEYVPTYEDKDGDWMLVGDVPWQMFTASCKRIRLKKSTEAVN